MTLGRNLVAGLSNSIWSAIVGLAVVPFYLEYLGIEAYGLIGFFVTAQSLLQLLDMGMASTINREVARCSAAGNIQYAGKLLHSLAVIYWSIAVFIAIVILSLAPLISEYWIQSSKIHPEIISHAIMLMGLVIACRWPIGLYQGVLIGANRLAISSIINIAMVTIGSVGAIFVLEFISPTIKGFFIWHACVGITYSLIIRVVAWRIVGNTTAEKFNYQSIRNILGFSLGVGAISLTGLALTQLDKVILSKTVGLENFGQYMLATMVANSIYILVIPIFNIVYPRFSSLARKKSEDEFFAEYGASSRMLSTLLSPIVMTLILSAKPLISLWTGNEALAIEVAPLASILLVAYGLHGLMHMPYALMLAEGQTSAMFKIYISLIAIMIPITTVFTINYGVIGGAWGQFLLFTLYVILGTYVTHRRYFRNNAFKWLLKDIGVPVGISLLVGIFGYWTLWTLKAGIYTELVLTLALWIIATLFSIYASRSIFVGLWGQFRYR